MSTLSRCLCLAMILALGCDGNREGVETGQTSDIQGLPSYEEVYATLESKEVCWTYEDEAGTEYDVAGATIYWLGQLEFTDADDVVGYEYQVLFPTPHFTEVNPEEGVECVIAWKAVGHLDRVEKCGACDYRVVVELSQDAGASTCSDGLQWGYSDLGGTAYYDVVTTCSGGSCDATIQGVSASGVQGAFTATGWASDGGIVYVDEGSCDIY